MKKQEYIKLMAYWVVLLMLHIQPIHAQRINHNFRNTSMSEALTTLAKSTSDYRINFMYNELEDFTVTTQVVKRTAPEAIRQIIGFYPMKMTIDGKNIFVECTQKTPTKMMGRVVDVQHHPVDFANVSLLNAQDSSFITGGVTNENGQFVIPCEVRKAIVKVSCVGYQTLTRTFDTGKIGSITLKEATMHLQKVVVKSSRPVVAIKGNALVTTVANSQLEHAGTANDVLRQIPMVTGRDGNFEVFGKGTPLIYINSRAVQDKNELSQLNSQDIKNVEVITNPGAKYDASIKSVIRIRTKLPQGEGFGGTLLAQNGFRHYFSSMKQANLKYRTGGLELFTNLNYYGGKFYSLENMKMETQGSTSWLQNIESFNNMRNNEFFGKLGFSWMINEHHSIGAYYMNGAALLKPNSNYSSTSYADGELDEEVSAVKRGRKHTVPKHHANIYYNGEVGKLGIDFNMDYMWRKKRETSDQEETNRNQQQKQVASTSIGHSRMFAEKLVLSYPLWKGQIEVGNEYIASQMLNDFHINMATIGNSNTKSDEKNMAGFFSIGQQLGKIAVEAGLRYEHVTFKYTENGQFKEDQSKTYNNVFPSLSISTEIGKTQWALSYTSKTQRPSYEDLDGTVTYVNRLLLGSGNSYLSPVKIHSVELMGAWKQFFAKVSYDYKKDAIINISKPYGENGEMKYLTLENASKIQELQAFIGAQFQIGIWQPKVNAGIIKQWFVGDYLGERKSFSNPLGIVQFQNAIHLPGDIWMNIDMEWNSRGNKENMQLSSSSSLNAKLYKAFCKNRFSVTLEGNDIFNKSNRDILFYNKDVTLWQSSTSDSRSLLLTFQYNFNMSRSRYKGQGAGNEELNRFE